MIPASFSELSSLGSRGRKRQAQEPVAIYKHVMDRLRQERLFAAHEEDDWNVVTAKILQDPSLPKPMLSRQLKDAHLFYSDVVGAELVTDLHAAEDIHPSAPLDPTYDAAATALEQNVLWQGIREHIIHSHEASCRTAIDMVVLTAVDLAQRQIEGNSNVDEHLRAGHSLSGLKSSRSNRPPVHSWVVLPQGVSIPDQQVLPSLAFHGTIDYLLAIISAVDARRAGGDDNFVMKRELVAHDGLRSGLLGILEATPDSPFRSCKSWAQVTTQGAALCVMTGRASIINALTDGRCWRFSRVSKTTVLDPTKRKSKRLSAEAREPKPKLTPFTTVGTPVYNIANHRDLAIVLRLLTISILSPAEDFESLSAGPFP
ncbi:hypothetical protein B0H12DRAFT_1078490 [Mycena haematopus]|nr:hypothetical protein B0H12DRAFT_1078490 [Mycena haematopus]